MVVGSVADFAQRDFHCEFMVGHLAQSGTRESVMSRRIIVLILLLLLYNRSSPAVVPLLEAMDAFVSQAMQMFRNLEVLEHNTPPIDEQNEAVKLEVQSPRFIPIRFNPIYSRQLAACAQPGDAVIAFTKELDGSPLERLTEAYRILRTGWAYRPDNIDGVAETFQSAEDSLTALNLAGDCEDFAAVMMSFCQVIGPFSSRIVIRDGKTPESSGHAYAEVLVADSMEKATSLMDQLATQWESAKVKYREDEAGIWVSLDFQPPTSHFEGGPISYYILPDGRISSP